MPTYNCPYCWYEVEKSDVSPKEFIYPHPPNFQWVSGYKKLPVICFWRKNWPDGLKESSEKCPQCNRDFHLEIWPFNPLTTPPWIIEKVREWPYSSSSPFLEKLIDDFCSFIFRNKYKNNSINIYTFFGYFLFALSIFFIIIIAPSLIFNSFLKLLKDYGLLIVFVIITVLLMQYKRHLVGLRANLTIEKLPLDLHQNYKSSSAAQILDEISFKYSIFGQPTPTIPIGNKIFKMPSPATIVGILVTIPLTILTFLICIPNAKYIFETSEAVSFPFFYSSAPFIFCIIIFYAVGWFLAGNIIWITIATPYLIGLIARYMPLKINPLDSTGGLDIFGKILFSSFLLIGIMSLVIPTSLIWSNFVSYDYFFITSILVTIIFILIFFLAFLYPLYPLHIKLKNKKQEEIGYLTKQIDYDEIKIGNVPFQEQIRKLFYFETMKKVRSMKEWPFNIDTQLKVLLTTISPMISFSLNYFISTF